MDKGAYVSLHVKIAEVSPGVTRGTFVSKIGNEWEALGESFDQAEALRMAEEDWKQDCHFSPTFSSYQQPLPCIGYEVFFESIFELADSRLGAEAPRWPLADTHNGGGHSKNSTVLRGSLTACSMRNSSTPSE